MSEREPRRPLSLAAHLVLTSGQVVDVRLVDLSNRGCKIHSSQHLWAGEHASFSVPGKGALGCTIRWSHDGFSGLEFDPAPDESPSKTETPRASVRVETSIEIKLRRVGRQNFNVRVRDLSRDGCKVELVERARLDESVQLVFPGLATIEAKVRWIDSFVAGLKFEQPFHPAVFVMLIERLGPQAGGR